MRKIVFGFFSISLKDIIIAFAAVTFFLSILPPLTYSLYAKDLISEESIMNSKNTGVVLLDRKGRPFFSFYQAKHNVFVPLSQIPQNTKNAVIAAEDKHFYNHSGFSIPAIAGAIVADIKYKNMSYGGSTITQQLVKNSLLNPDKNLLRKYQEVILAEEIERRYNKEQILEMYLNSVYFGEGAFGIEEAAQTYFGKTVKDLDLAESSMLAGLLPAPSAMSPISGDYSLARKRQQYVLSQMQEQGWITPEQKNEAQVRKLSFQGNREDINTKAPHFAIMARDELIKKYGEETIARSGFKVKTTIDLDYQEFAEQTVKNQVTSLSKNNVSNGAAVVMDPKTGELISVVGSIDWDNEEFGKLNIATANRPPGSSFKPIVYAKALEDKEITPATMLSDNPTKFKNSPNDTVGYEPKDYDRKYRGKVTTRRALSNSLNIPSVEVMSKVGVPKALEAAKSLGITTLGDDPSNYGLSLVLGTGNVKLLELTDAYAAFANSGSRIDPTTLLEIKDKHDQVIYTHRPESVQVLSPEVVFLISSILSDSKSRREIFGGALDTPFPAAVKTGTTEDYKDAWTLGYTPLVAVGVWVGNNDGQPMDQIAGSLGAAPIWKLLVAKYLEDKPKLGFTKPDGILAIGYCGSPIKTASADEGSIQGVQGGKEYFLAGTQTLSCIPNPTASPSARPSSTPTPSSNNPLPNSGIATPSPTPPNDLKNSPPPPEGKNNNRDKKD